MKTKTWILLIAALAAVLAALSVWTLSQKGGHVVEIVQDGEVVRTMDLDRVTAEESFVLTCPEGSNTVLVQPGRICVKSADCPDRICVQRGWLTEGTPIVCMPHKLIIRAVEETP